MLALLLANALTLKFRHQVKRTRKNDSGPTETHVISHIRTYRIKGMNCNHCRTNVERAIASLDQVEEVHVSLETCTAEVRGPVSDEEVRAAVEYLGFSLDPLPE